MHTSTARGALTEEEEMSLEGEQGDSLGVGLASNPRRHGVASLGYQHLPILIDQLLASLLSWFT